MESERDRAVAHPHNKSCSQESNEAEKRDKTAEWERTEKDERQGDEITGGGGVGEGEVNGGEDRGEDGWRRRK